MVQPAVQRLQVVQNPAQWDPTARSSPSPRTETANQRQQQAQGRQPTTSMSTGRWVNGHIDQGDTDRHHRSKRSNHEASTNTALTVTAAPPGMPSPSPSRGLPLEEAACGLDDCCSCSSAWGCDRCMGTSSTRMGELDGSDAPRPPPPPPHASTTVVPLAVTGECARAAPGDTDSPSPGPPSPSNSPAGNSMDGKSEGGEGPSTVPPPPLPPPLPLVLAGAWPCP